MADVEASHRTLLIILLAIALVLADVPCRGNHEESTTPWQASLAVSSKQVLPAEPVLVTLRLAYAGEPPFVGYASFGRASLGYSTPSGQRRGFSLSSPPFGAAGDELPPGRGLSYHTGYATTENVLILYDSRHGAHFFEEPGTGSFSAYLEVWAGTGRNDYRIVAVRSDPVAVRVLPLPGKEAGAFSLWSGREAARMFLTGESDARTQANLKSLLHRYPKSAYAKYALMALAKERRRKAEEIWERSLAAQRNEQVKIDRLLREEIGLLEQVLERNPRFHLAPVVMAELIEDSEELGDQSRVCRYAKMLLALSNVPQEFRDRATQALAAERARTPASTPAQSPKPAAAPTAPPK